MKQLEVVARCKARIRVRGFRFPRYRTCTRAAVRDGYCKQHHPETVKARGAKTRENQQRKMDQHARPFMAMSKLEDARAYLMTLGPPGTPLTSDQAATLWKLIKL